MSFNCILFKDVIKYILEFIDEEELSFYVTNKQNYELKDRIILNRKYTEKYYTNNEFKIRVDNYRLKIYGSLISSDYVKDISIFSKFYSLNLSNCRLIKDVSMLGNIYSLNLSNCDSFFNDNLSALSKVHTLNLSYCYQITDVRMLGNIHTLNLSSCHLIKDVSML